VSKTRRPPGSLPFADSSLCSIRLFRLPHFKENILTRKRLDVVTFLNRDQCSHFNFPLCSSSAAWLCASAVNDGLTTTRRRDAKDTQRERRECRLNLKTLSRDEIYQARLVPCAFVSQVRPKLERDGISVNLLSTEVNLNGSIDTQGASFLPDACELGRN
jgi:hypothetical protein